MPRETKLPAQNVQSPQKTALTKVNSLEELIKTTNSKFVYAIVNNPTKTIILLENRNNAIRIRITNVANNRFFNTIPIANLEKLITVLTELQNDLQKLGLKQTAKSTKVL